VAGRAFGELHSAVAGLAEVLEVTTLRELVSRSCFARIDVEFATADLIAAGMLVPLHTTLIAANKSA